MSVADAGEPPGGRRRGERARRGAAAREERRRVARGADERGLAQRVPGEQRLGGAQASNGALVRRQERGAVRLAGARRPRAAGARRRRVDVLARRRLDAGGEAPLGLL